MQKLYKDDAVQLLAKGVNEVADIVKTTLGGKGKNVVIRDENGMVHIINDGVTIANHIEGEEGAASAGAELAKAVARQTNVESGDGTTTSIVLLQEYLNELKEVMQSVKPSEARAMREQLQKEVGRICDELDRTKKAVLDSELEKVAKISCLDDQMAKEIAKVILAIGRDGAIVVDDAQKAGMSHEIVKGIQIEDGYASPYLITQAEGGKAIMSDVPILLSRKRIDDITMLMPLLEDLGKSGRKMIAIFAKEFSDDVMAFFVVNKVQGKLLPILVATDDLEEIETTTGAKIISEENGKKYTLENLGTAGKVVVTQYKSVVMDGGADQLVIDNKINQLKKHLESAETPAEKYRLQERIAKLKGGVAVVKIAGNNEQESREKKLKMEDAINSVKSAIEEGVVEGGGMALWKIAHKFYKEEKTEVESLLFRVLTKPARQIIENADEEEKVFNELENMKGNGYNVVTRQYEDFMVSGVMDPVKVTKASVKNAVSMGNTILTASASVIYSKDKK